MKQKKSIITIFLLILTFVILELFSYVSLNLHTFNKDEKTTIFQEFIKNLTFTNLNQIYLNPSFFRPAENSNSQKSPIVLFGCNYVYGSDLNNNETFSYWLGKLTQKPIYNKASNAWGIQHMLYQLKTKDFYKTTPKPQHVLYVYTQNHLGRMKYGSNLYSGRYIFYKISNNQKLERDYVKEIALRSNILTKLCSKAKSNTKNQPTNEELNLLKLHILECNKEIKENWGNSTKFIVILLEKESSINKIKGILPDLEKENITILNINNLNKSFKSKEYQLSKDNPHPNAKFWREITPKIIDKLDLN